MVWLHEAASTPGLESVRDILSINPGIPFDERVWPFVGYKGGSEKGVFAMSWLLERHDGRLFFLAVILNDGTRRIDETRVARSYPLAPIFWPMRAEAAAMAIA